MESSEEKRKRFALSDEQVFLWCCVGGTCLFLFWTWGMCCCVLDEVIVVLSALGFMMMPFFFKYVKQLP